MVHKQFLYVFLALGLVVGNVFAKENQVLDETAIKAPTLVTVGVLTSKLPQRDPIHIKHENMGVLNAILALNASVVVRMDYAASRASKVLKKMDQLKDTKQDVNTSVAYIMETLTEFFEHVKNFKGQIQPVLLESLAGAYATSYINRVIESPLDVKTFLAQEVSTKVQLADLCHELIHFFKDLRKSFTPKVKTAAKAAAEEMKRAQSATH